MKYFCYIIFVSIFLSSCVSRVEKSGYMFEMSNFESLSKGISSKLDVLKAMGNPTIGNENEENKDWIYYSEEIKHFLFFMPKVTSREIVVLKFNEENLLATIQKYDLEDQDHNFDFHSYQTIVKTNKPNLFKDLFGNLGKVNPI